MAQEQEPVKMAGVIQVDEKPIQDHLGQMLRAAWRETLNQLLDAEADRRAEPGAAGYAGGELRTAVGDESGGSTLRVPKLRTVRLNR